jgi:NAD+ synthase
METCSFTRTDNMNCEEIKRTICEWLKSKLSESKCDGFVIGVSGGIDSAVVSTLCALTNIPTIVVGMPINQEKAQLNRSMSHMQWLRKNYSNVSYENIDLSEAYAAYKSALVPVAISELADANLQSRLRMCCLYGIANTKNYIVVGTGNKVEDYGIGFFTKYGDGGVDISPIADLLKSEVRKVANHLGISREIIKAKPTDGLWGDDRSDEDQIGATYEELEWALDFYDSGAKPANLSERQVEVLKIYRNRHINTKHKLETPPVCYINKELK